MPLKNYGVAVGYPTHYTAEDSHKDSKSPHIYLYYDDSPDVSRAKNHAAINIKSTSKESRLVYWFYRDFRHPITSELEGLNAGFTDLPSDERGGLDYIRGNILENNDGTLVEHDLPGANNDIIDYMKPILDNAIAAKAKTYIFGEPFNNGIHDVHMNQGNAGGFARDNGPYQDGGLLIAFPDGHWEAVFLAFAVQAIHTNDQTGNAIGNVDWAQYLGSVAPNHPDDDNNKTVDNGGTSEWSGKVIIRAALIGDEKVYLQNQTNGAVKVDGWTLQNRQGQSQTIHGSIGPSSYKAFEVRDAPLSKKGGTITLLEDKSSLKVDGVSYTSHQARREGKLLYFH
jgi:uncharacterized protein YukJ